MMCFTLEFDNKTELERCITVLQDEYGVTGELSASPLAEGRWELQVVSEQTLRDSAVQNLPGRRVEAAP